MPDLKKILENNPDGITFFEASTKTMELNPARRLHYEQYIRQLRDEQLVEIVRDDKVFNGNGSLKRQDIIRKRRTTQLSFFKFPF
ncbi:hypothetical protein [Pseudanabaena sp. Chao 1811]|uniref:hypothetical protein n=1 Tax=Pseudanabaena sp. Chao 1811 TaxID=2963092 RepID=UPI0022F3D95E|nr:hypothetical protein [Pseudanabaena sp. Chao 1811]